MVTAVEIIVPIKKFLSLKSLNFIKEFLFSISHTIKNASATREKPLNQLIHAQSNQLYCCPLSSTI